jgi:hyperosmotically inducible periplasmic protein
MKKYYISGFIGACFALLAACQTVGPRAVFSSGNSDQAITSSVYSALGNNENLAPLGIHVQTQQGTVILDGYVKTIRQSDTAADVASKVAGVKTVENNLIVRK